MKKAGTVVQVALAAFLLLYAADWALLHSRASHGTAYGSVPVAHYLMTPLKGSKAEYDYMGTTPETCSHSLFPQGGNSPCWWLARHASRWQ